MIEYQIENDLIAEEFTALLINSTLGERRPVNEPERIAKMLEHGNLIITARHNGTGHQRRDKNSSKPIAPIGDGACGHDARYGTGEAGK